MKWTRVFVDTADGATAPQSSAFAPRRRQAVRYVYSARVRAKATSWDRGHEMVTGDVGAGGFFLVTALPTQPGERIEVEVTVGEDRHVTVRGTVVAVITEAMARKSGREQGLGVKMDPLEGEPWALYDEVLTLARAAAPTPEDPASPSSPAPGSRTSGAMRATQQPLDRRVRTSGPWVVGRAQPVSVVGIRLGTSATSVSAIRGPKITVLSRLDGAKSIASVVSFPSKGTHVVGSKARTRQAIDPTHTIVSPLRLLGAQYDDPATQEVLRRGAYRHRRAPDGGVLVDMWGVEYDAATLCSFLFADVRALAAEALGEEVTRAVVTLPITAEEVLIRLVREAAGKAGLEVVAFVDEPTAAALANRYAPGFGGNIGVFDFGGATFEFSVIDVARGDFRVLATSGDTLLGGEDIDQALAGIVGKQFWDMNHVDLREQPVQWQRLVTACEKAKRDLTLKETAVIHVTELLQTPKGSMDLHMGIERPTLDHVCVPFVERTLNICYETLSLLQLDPSDLTGIYLSGGTTYIPTIWQSLAYWFGVPVVSAVPADLAVCMGAAIHGAQLQLRRLAS